MKEGWPAVNNLDELANAIMFRDVEGMGHEKGNAALVPASRVLWRSLLPRCPRTWPACRSCHPTEDT